jgi:hypothetical protein
MGFFSAADDGGSLLGGIAESRRFEFSGTALAGIGRFDELTAGVPALRLSDAGTARIGVPDL